MSECVSFKAGIARRDLLKAAALAALPLNLAPYRADATMRPATPPMQWGVNLAGAEFGKLLGRHGTEYLYPTPENIEYYARLGFSLVRIPFKWERLQRELKAPFNPAELKRLESVVDHATVLGLTVVLDPHNYAKRRLAAENWRHDHLIGSDAVPLGAFLDFWSRLSDVFKSRETVVFGLMNEPTEVKAPRWLEIANATIAAIRAQRARNLILVPGTDYTGAHSWFRAGNTAMEGVRDPLGNVALEVHQYLDGDSSGTHPSAVSSTVGSERIEPFQSWARSHGFRAFLGEYNAGRDAVSARALMDLCDELAANSDVWLGSAAWAGGPRWPDDYMFNLQPTRDGRIREQTAIIRSRTKPTRLRRYWDGASASLYVDFARARTSGGTEPRSVLRVGREDEARELPLDAKGLRLGASASGRPLLADGPLAKLFDSAEFTLLVELRDTELKGADRDILTSGKTRLLYLSARGELGTDLGGGLATAPLPPDAWKGKRRCALAVHSATGEMIIGVTGAPPVSGHDVGPFFPTKPAPDAPLRIEIGGGPQTGGYICRLVGFPVFLATDDLSANIA